MTTPVGDITGGVDTHLDFHVAAAHDGLGRELGTEKFPTTQTGYTALLAWLRAFGPLAVVGAEGTGSYGAGLTSYLTSHDMPVVEVNRPNRQKRRLHGKSDPHDASTPPPRPNPVTPPPPRNSAPALSSPSGCCVSSVSN